MIDQAISDAFEGLCLPSHVAVENDGAIVIRYRNGMIFRGEWQRETEQPTYAGRWERTSPRFWA